MARIGLLLTRTPWQDRRQYHRQGPALLAAGHTVVYLAGVPRSDLDYPYEAVPLSAGERRLAALTGGLNLLAKVTRARLDVVQICSVELLPLGIALKLSNLTKVVYDCREDMPSAMREHKVRFPKPVRIVLSQMTRLLEGAGDRLFDGLVSADPATARLHPRLAEDRRVVFLNVAPKKHFPVDGPDLAARAYDVAIVGSMSERTGVFDVIEATSALRERGLEIKVLIVGKPDESLVRAMRARIAALGLDERFEWRGWVDHTEIPELLYDTRVGIVSLHDYAKFRRNIAAKALEFIAARMVTVASDLPPQRLFLKDGQNAVFYAPGDASALAQALFTVLSDPAAAQRLADQARRDFLAIWNLERIATDYTRLFERIAGEPAGLMVKKTRNVG